jgi:hypothetical protein
MAQIPYRSIPRRLTIYGMRTSPRIVFHRLPIVLKSVLVTILSEIFFSAMQLIPLVHLAVINR